MMLSRIILDLNMAAGSARRIFLRKAIVHRRKTVKIKKQRGGHSTPLEN